MLPTTDLFGCGWYTLQLSSIPFELLNNTLLNLEIDWPMTAVCSSSVEVPQSHQEFIIEGKGA